jgi:hypothetical protein
MKIVIKFCATLLCFLALPVMAHERHFGPVSRSDVEAGVDMPLRKSNPNLYLSGRGDFNGDRVIDDVRFVKNGEGEVFVEVTLNGPKPLRHLLDGGPFDLKADMPRMGLDVLKPSTQKTACAKGYGAPKSDCRPEFTSKFDSIEVFTFEAGSVAYSFQDGQFISESMSD